MTGAAPFGPRVGHAVTSFGTSKLMLAGGRTRDALGTLNKLKNDVWQSQDGGTTWLPLTENAPWSARYGHVLQLFGGEWLLMGGLTPIPQNDVWVSANGTSWSTYIESHAPWSPRAFAAVAVFDGDLYIAGGTDLNQVFNDVWSTANGSTFCSMGVEERDGVGGESRVWFWEGKEERGVCARCGSFPGRGRFVVSRRPPQRCGLRDTRKGRLGGRRGRGSTCSCSATDCGSSAARRTTRIRASGARRVSAVRNSRGSGAPTQRAHTLGRRFRRTGVFTPRRADAWKQVAPSMPWGVRNNMGVALLGSSFLAFGGAAVVPPPVSHGIPTYQFMNDVWKSRDPCTWLMRGAFCVGFRTGGRRPFRSFVPCTPIIFILSFPFLLFFSLPSPSPLSLPSLFGPWLHNATRGLARRQCTAR